MQPGTASEPGPGIPHDSHTTGYSSRRLSGTSAEGGGTFISVLVPPAPLAANAFAELSSKFGDLSVMFFIPGFVALGPTSALPVKGMSVVLESSKENWIFRPSKVHQSKINREAYDRDLSLKNIRKIWLTLTHRRISRYFEQKAGPKAAIRMRNEDDEKFSIDELKLHCAIRIRIPEHTQDHDRYESQEIYQPLGLQTGNSGAHRRGSQRSSFESRIWGSSLGETRASPRAQRSRADEYFERTFFTRKYDKSQDIRILLETAHPVRGHKEAGPMNSSPRANATKARTLGGIWPNAARVLKLKLGTKTRLRFAPTSMRWNSKRRRGADVQEESFLAGTKNRGPN
ncbi:hypothetical protein B0H13DRAFT_1922860 [Mycena leptocephala]|nr:hypothetical protein B0H13DRAFT_1922860 [Mycena leptocephala]